MGNTTNVMREAQDVSIETDAVMVKYNASYSISDPRSPSEQFTRTPIEVKHSAVHSTKTRSRIAQPMESLGAVERGSYVMSAANILKERQRIRLLSDDPRSPTPGILRTPIQVFSPARKDTEIDESSVSTTSTTTSEDYETGDDLLFALNDCPSGLPSKDLNYSPADSPIVIGKQPKTIADNVFIDEDIPITKAVTCPSTKKQNHNTSEKEICVKLFHTPPAKTSALKVRMPLRAYSANESLPQQILRAKQTRGIMENMDVENNPPKAISDAWTSIPSYLK